MTKSSTLGGLGSDLSHHQSIEDKSAFFGYADGRRYIAYGLVLHSKHVETDLLAFHSERNLIFFLV